MSDFIVSKFGRNRSELAVLNFSEEVGLKLSEERKLTYVDDVKDDATGPDIRRKAVVGLFTDEVWIHVVGCSAEDSQFFFWPGFQTETEIDDLDIF